MMDCLNSKSYFCFLIKTVISLRKKSDSMKVFPAELGGHFMKHWKHLTFDQRKMISQGCGRFLRLKLVNLSFFGSQLDSFHLKNI